MRRTHQALPPELHMHGKLMDELEHILQAIAPILTQLSPEGAKGL